MCLALPMQVKTLDGSRAVCAAKGVTREVSLFLLRDQPLAEGDFVLVHVGYAIQKISLAAAASTWELLDEALAADA